MAAETYRVLDADAPPPPLLDAILANSADGVLLIDGESNQITLCNRAAAQIFRRPAADLVGQGAAFLYPDAAAYRASRRRIDEAVGDAGTFRGRWQLRRADGALFPAAVTAAPLAPGRPELLLMVRDIEEKQQTEQRLHRLSRVIEQSPDAILITDVNGRIEYVNPKFTQLTGYTLEEVQGRQPNLLKSGQTPDAVYRDLWQTLLAGEEWRGELQNRKKSGDLYWVSASMAPVTDAEGRITHLLAVEEDITAQKEIETALRQRNRELILLNQASHALGQSLELDRVLRTLLEEVKRLLDVLACSVWLKDRETGDLVCRQITDPQAEEVRGWRLPPGVGLAHWVVDHGQSLVVPDTRREPRHFRGVDEQTSLEIRSVLTAPLQGKQEVVGVIQVVDTAVSRFTETDVTLMEALAASAAGAIENARLFTELKDAQAQLVNQERLAALGQMSATIAHELRNPLMAIRMGVEYLLQDVARDDARWRGAALMQSNMDRIDRLIEDILFLSRPTQPKLAPDLLLPLLEEEVARWELPLASKELTLHTDLARQLRPAALDGEQMCRALTNLIGNSVDALAPGGKMTLTLHADDHHQIIRLTDDGPGISPEHLPHIFEPFYTTKSRGTGLGLSIVKQIIDYHQGQIEVESEVGVGTTFTIRLPLLQNEPIG